MRRVSESTRHIPLGASAGGLASSVAVAPMFAVLLAVRGARLPASRPGHSLVATLPRTAARAHAAVRSPSPGSHVTVEAAAHRTASHPPSNLRSQRRCQHSEYQTRNNQKSLQNCLLPFQVQPLCQEAGVVNC